MKLAFVTGSRSEWRLIEPLLAAARQTNDCDPQLYVTGSHLSPRHGFTLDEITAAGWRPAACIEILEESDSPLAVTRATGRAVYRLADVLDQKRPEWVVVAGDRYESFAAGLAATMLGIPLAHLAGGETDLSTNQDGNLRNALTKLAQVHLVAHELAARRVAALGEEAWRIRVVGLPSLDGIVAIAAPRAAPVQRELVLEARPFILVNYLPVTLRPAESLAHLRVLLAALAGIEDCDKLFVLSNADAGGDEHDALIRAWAAQRSDARLAAAIPPPLYLAALRDCACMVGNSSSGVIESPAFGTPSVIVGPRQQGRLLAQNTREVLEPQAGSLADAIRCQIAHGRYQNAASYYGEGGSAARVLAALRELHRRADLLAKRLVLPEGGA